MKIALLVCLGVVAGLPAFLGSVWVVDRAAGTWWAVPIAAGVVGVAFCGGWLSDHRPSNLTPLQRFDKRQERRAA